MKAEEKNTLQSIFEAIEDPRVERTKKHQLIDSIIVALLGVLCGADGWVDSESFGTTKEAWLMVSAWASENRMVLAQVAVNEKSNEITALPEVLKLLVLEGCIVTIDAMGTQRAIAAQIIEGHGDYALALKDNQRNVV